jgi:hypothetical protein
MTDLTEEIGRYRATRDPVCSRMDRQLDCLRELASLFEQVLHEEGVSARERAKVRTAQEVLRRARESLGNLEPIPAAQPDATFDFSERAHLIIEAYREAGFLQRSTIRRPSRQRWCTWSPARSCSTCAPA